MDSDDELTFMLRVRNGWMEAGVVGKKGAVHSWQRWSNGTPSLGHPPQWNGGLEFHYRLAEGEEPKPWCAVIESCRYFDGGRCATTGSSLAYSEGPWRNRWPQCEPDKVRIDGIDLQLLQIALTHAYMDEFATDESED